MKDLLTTLVFWLAIQNVSNEDICEPKKDSVFSLDYNGCKQVFLCEKKTDHCKNLSNFIFQYITNYELEAQEKCISFHKGSCPDLKDDTINLSILYPKGWMKLKFPDGFLMTKVEVNVTGPKKFISVDVNFDNGQKIKFQFKDSQSVSKILPSGEIDSRVFVNISVNFAHKMYYKHPSWITFYGTTVQMKCNVNRSQRVSISNSIKECLSRDKKMLQMYDEKRADLIMYDFSHQTYATTSTKTDKSNTKSKPKPGLTTGVSNTVDETNRNHFSHEENEETGDTSGSGMDTEVTIRTIQSSTYLAGENSHLLATVTRVSHSSSFPSVNTGSTSTQNCFCACQKKKSKFWLKDLAKELKVDKKNTSRYLASKISVKDDRPSSQFIGGVSIVIMVSLGSIICIPDLITLAIFLREKLIQ